MMMLMTHKRQLRLFGSLGKLTIQSPSISSMHLKDDLVYSTHYGLFQQSRQLATALMRDDNPGSELPQLSEHLLQVRSCEILKLINV